MRIAIVTGPFFSVPPAPCGGVEKVWHGLAREFSASGHDVTMYARAHPGLPAHSTDHGVTIIRRYTFNKTSNLTIDVFKDLLYSTAVACSVTSHDIIVTNAFWLPVILSVIRPRLGHVVVSVERFPKGQLFLYRNVSRLRSTSMVVHQAVLSQMRGKEHLVRAIPTPVTIGPFRKWSGVRSQSEGGGVILYVGRVHPEKGVTLLVEAFRRIHGKHPNLRLRIVGPTESWFGGGGDGYLSVLRAKAVGLPVEIAGRIPEADLAGAIGTADFYCYPTLADRGESFPLAPLEAMASGLAPIVSDLECFRDYIEHGITGSVFDHRASDPVNELVRALETQIHNPARTRMMGEQAARRAEDFDISRVARMFLDDFAHIVSGDESPTYSTAGTKNV